MSNIETGSVRMIDRKSFMKKLMTEKGWAIFRAALIISISFVLLYPVLYMISVALRPSTELGDPTVIWIPKTVTFKNIIDTFGYMHYMDALKNTVKVDLVSSLIQIFSCSIVGYGLARIKFKLKGVIFAAVLITIIFPPQITIIPMFLNYRNFNFFGIGKLIGFITGTPLTINLINTPLTFYLPAFFGMGIKSGLFIYVFRQFFKGLPKELEDAAYVDGCGPFQTYFWIMLPNVIPALITVFAFSVVWYWNDYYNVVMYLTNVPTISTALAGLSNNIRPSMGGSLLQDPFLVQVCMQAGSLLAVAPLLILYVFLQKYLTESIERTGIVG